MEKLKIIIMDTPIGSGHKKAADALEEELLGYDNIIVLRLSVFDFIPQFLAWIFLRSYLYSLKISPGIYKFLYKWGNKDGKSTMVRDVLNRILASSAEKKIVEFAPDVIVATHATAGGIAAVLKSKGRIQASIYGVVTDYVMHGWWYYREVQGYFTADMDINNIVFAEFQQVYRYGIPVRKIFVQQNAVEKATLKNKLGIATQLHICLVLGGGEGLLPMGEIAAKLGNGRAGYALLNITGNNKSLLEELQGRSDTEVFNCGYVENIQDYMRVADVVVSKAGGISSTEILTQGVPYIVYSPLPGQESNNALYLQKKYGVHIAEGVEDLADCLQNLGGIVPNYKQINPCASRDIAQQIVRNFEKAVD